MNAELQEVPAFVGRLRDATRAELLAGREPKPYAAVRRGGGELEGFVLVLPEDAVLPFLRSHVASVRASEVALSLVARWRPDRKDGDPMPLDDPLAVDVAMVAYASRDGVERMWICEYELTSKGEAVNVKDWVEESKPFALGRVFQ